MKTHITLTNSLFVIFLLITMSSWAQRKEIHYYSGTSSESYTWKKTGSLELKQKGVEKSGFEDQPDEKLDNITIDSEKGEKEYNTLGFCEKYGFFNRLFNNPEVMVIGVGGKRNGIATYIAPKKSKKAVFVESLNIKAHSLRSSNLCTIAVHLYPIDRENKTIGKDLLQNDVAFELDTIENIKNIDVSKKKIRIPEKGVLAVIQKKINKSGNAIIKMKNSKLSEVESYFFKSSSESVKINPIHVKINSKKEGRLKQNFQIGFTTYYFTSD